MRNILAFLAAVTLTVGIAGWYLGWYSVRTTPSSSGHRSVNIDFNTSKIGQDLQKGATQVQKVLDKNGEKVADKPAEKGELLDKPLPVEPGSVINSKFEFDHNRLDQLQKTGKQEFEEFRPFKMFER